MSANSPIEWTGRTWNPLVAVLKRQIDVPLKNGGTRTFAAGTRGWFCTKCSEGCANCYAETINFRLGNGLLYSTRGLADIEFRIAHIGDPHHWRKPQLVFVNSMTDLFHEAVPDCLIDVVIAVIASAPQHTFQVLTKRAKRMRDYFNAPDLRERILWLAQSFSPSRGVKAELQPWPLPNLWLGVSVENPSRGTERIPHLLDTPAAVRFLSCEPLLGLLDLTHMRQGDNQWFPLQHIHWVIAGGESGPKARPMHPEWLRSLRNQCLAAHVPFFFKQWGEWAPCPIGNGPDLVTDSVFKRGPAHDGLVWRIGKKKAGRLLDGIEHNGWPAAYQKGARP